MITNTTLSTSYRHLENEIIRILKNFKNEGTMIADGKRNIIKYFDINDQKVNFKSFKQPNYINRIAYKYLRKSKARRSFEYAKLLISKNIHTPEPIAFIENYNFLGLTSSHYICEHLNDAFTIRKVFMNPTFKDRVKIIKGYTLLMYQLHEHGIEFIDNTAGNILIKKVNDQYHFFLVDLNRMNFYKKIKMVKRLENLSRITNDLQTIKIISAEYASLSNESEIFCLKQIIEASLRHAYRRKLKNKLKFYKSFNLKGAFPISLQINYKNLKKNDNQAKLAE